jgi:hypothetical protein
MQRKRWKRCEIPDRGVRCRRRGRLGRLRFGRLMCNMHYKRAIRKKGDARHYMEIRAVKAQERRAKLRKMREELYGNDPAE